MKTIRDESIKKFITILSEISKRYKSVESPKAAVYGNAILSITEIGSHEFKKRMDNGEKVKYFGPKLTAMYKEFQKTGKCKKLKQMDEIIQAELNKKKSKESLSSRIDTLNKEIRMLNKSLKEHPRKNKDLVEEIESKKVKRDKLREKLYNMSDVSDNSNINFSEVLSILIDRVENL